MNQEERDALDGNWETSFALIRGKLSADATSEVDRLLEAARAWRARVRNANYDKHGMAPKSQRRWKSSGLSVFEKLQDAYVDRGPKGFVEALAAHIDQLRPWYLETDVKYADLWLAKVEELKCHVQGLEHGARETAG